MMNYLETVHRSFSVKLVALTVLIIILSALLSTAFFYFGAGHSIGGSYEEKISLLTLYRFEVVRESVFIFIGFALIAIFGISVIGILQTHKVVGPLVRTRAVARQLAEGNFDVAVKFREDDMIHAVADSLNGFARSYGGRYQQLRSGIQAIHCDALALRELIDAGDMEGAAATRLKMVERMQELSRMLGGIKV
jgi:methyl-accepting chemotaxis protein